MLESSEEDNQQPSLWFKNYLKVQRLTLETMKIKIFTKAPAWWTPEEWEMSPEQREKSGIKLVEIEYNSDTSALPNGNVSDDIV